MVLCQPTGTTATKRPTLLTLKIKRWESSVATWIVCHQFCFDVPVTRERELKLQLGRGSVKIFREHWGMALKRQIEVDVTTHRLTMVECPSKGTPLCPT